MFIIYEVCKLILKGRTFLGPRTSSKLHDFPLKYYKVFGKIFSLELYTYMLWMKRLFTFVPYNSKMPKNNSIQPLFCHFMLITVFAILSFLYFLRNIKINIIVQESQNLISELRSNQHLDWKQNPKPRLKLLVTEDKKAKSTK